jgi:uncharacterized RDD family membrane protein YckC
MSTAAGPAPAPAGLLRRYLAWSLDMVVPLAVAGALCATRIAAAAARVSAALDALAQRMAQAALDALVHGAGPLALARDWLGDPAWREAVAALSVAVTDVVVAPMLLAATFALAWFAGFEASPLQATPGKRALGLRVEGVDGARLGPGRAALRHVAGALSWLTLNFGHLLAAMPSRHQALHDRIAGARVLQRRDGRLPAWSIGWLVLQLFAAAAAGACLFLSAHRAIERAFDALL